MKKGKEYTVFGDLSKIQKLLINLEYYSELHPLIKSVKKVKIESTEYKEYRIKERPYNWIPINIQYSAQVKSFENTIEYKIIGIPFSKVNVTYIISQVSESENHIAFKLSVTGKLIGKGVLMNKMMAAQNKLMKALNKELANPRILK